jgi:uncharacterized Zn finger protein
MVTKEFAVASSSGSTSYPVRFFWNGKDLHVTCGCKAGILGQSCKHKVALMSGDRSILAVDADLTEVLRWIQDSPVRSALSRLGDAEARVEEAQAEARKAKKCLLDLISPGVKRERS